MNIVIRETIEGDRENIYRVESEAFGYEKEAKLVDSLLDDPTARPYLSLLAQEGDRAVGHILFTAASIAESRRKVSLLAPLSVVPDAQGKGVGGRLIQAGLERLAEAGVDLVFVLGHPTYYPRLGFVPAHTYGLEAPYPIPADHSDAWMVQGLHPSALAGVCGRVTCAGALDQPEHWREQDRSCGCKRGGSSFSGLIQPIDRYDDEPIVAENHRKVVQLGRIDGVENGKVRIVLRPEFRKAGHVHSVVSVHSLFE